MGLESVLFGQVMKIRTTFCDFRCRPCRKAGFSLTELLVVIAIMSLLMSILLPCLSRARQQVRTTICQSNIRQLYIANIGYASDNDDYYVRAAHDMVTLDTGEPSSGGMHRWHGVRQSDGVHPDPNQNIFDPRKGPLGSYLADGQVKQCPRFVEFVKDGNRNAFEAGCGGYGYNLMGVGSRSYKSSWAEDPMRSSMQTAEIDSPGKKVMFTDTAFLDGYSGDIIEYSFCEPPKFVFAGAGGVVERGRPQPSIHFRHLGATNVIFCDGHFSSEELSFPESKLKEPDQFKIGWFGPKDNSLFRP